MINFFNNIAVRIILLLFLAFFISCMFLQHEWYAVKNDKVVGILCDRFYQYKIIGVPCGTYYIYRGDKYYSKGELNKAVKYYNTGLKEYPEHSQARCNLANIYVSYEDYSSAVKEYKQALKYNPKYMACRMDLAIILAETLSRYDEAIEEYQTVANTKRFPINIPLIYNNTDATNENHEYAYYNMGLAYRGKSLYIPREKLKNNVYLKNAAESYKKALKINKNSYDSLYNLALTHHLLGNAKDAGLNYCKAIEKDPLKYDAHLNLGILLDSLKYYPEAIDEYRKAGLLIDSGDSETLLYLNQLLSDSYKNDAINKENKKSLNIIVYEQEPKKEKNFIAKFFEKFKKKNDKKTKNDDIAEDKTLDEEEQNVIFKKGKIELKEETGMGFKKRMSTCESKDIFKEMK